MHDWTYAWKASRAVAHAVDRVVDHAAPVFERSASPCAARRSATRSAPSAGRLPPAHAALITASSRRTCACTTEVCQMHAGG